MSTLCDSPPSHRPALTRSSSVMCFELSVTQQSCCAAQSTQPGRCSTAQHIMIQDSIAQHCPGPHSPARHRIAQPSTTKPQHSSRQHTSAQHGMIQHSPAQVSTACCHMLPHGPAQHSIMQHGPAQHKATQHITTHLSLMCRAQHYA